MLDHGSFNIEAIMSGLPKCEPISRGYEASNIAKHTSPVQWLMEVKSVQCSVQHCKKILGGSQMGPGFFFRLIQTLPTFWAERILILRIFIFRIFLAPSLGPAWSRLGPSLGPAWARLGPSLGPALARNIIWVTEVT